MFFLAAGFFFVFSGGLAAQINLHPGNTGVTANTLSFSWDAGTSFIAALSTATDFSALTATGTVLTNSAAYTNLNPDTIYYFRVKNQSDASYNPLNQISSVTYAAAPTTPYFISEYFTADSSVTAQISVAWEINGNPDWTDYEIQYADNSGFSNSKTYAENYPPVILGGLAANTTYFLRVRAVNLYGNKTVFTAPDISTATMALNLRTLSNMVYETSATVSWTAVSGPAQAQDSEGYRLMLSTSNIFDSLPIALNSAEHYTSSFGLTGLDRNTTYYYKVGALNWNGAANFDYGQFVTLSAKLQNPQLLNFSDQWASLGWTALPASPPAASALGYRLEASSTNFNGSGIILSSSVYDMTRSTLTVQNLEPNTTWYFRAASLNGNLDANYTGAPSTITLALPFSSNTTATLPGPRSLTVTFTPLPASPQAFSCEGYRFEGSSAPFGAGSIVHSSSTDLNQLNSLTLSELKPNTSYYLRLGTLTWNKAPHYTDLNVAKTSLPGPLESVVLGSVWVTSAAVSFTSAGADSYVVEASTYQYFSWVFASSATVNSDAAGLIVEGLPANTVFNYRAGSLYSGTTVYSNTTPSKKSTLAPPLLNQLISGVFYSSVTVGWTLPASWPPDFTGEKYLLETSTSADFQGVIFSSRSNMPQTAALSIAGLSPNASYYFRAGTLNWDNVPDFVYTPSTSTLANAPTQQLPKPSDLTPSAITFNWQTNSNPADTRYWAEFYHDSGFTSFLSSATTTLSSATFSDLYSNTTYYTRVTAVNRLDRASPTVIFSPMATGAYDPASHYPLSDILDIGVSSITINWKRGSNPPDITYYLAKISSEAAFSGTVLSSVTASLTATFTGLVPNASYYLQVSALNLTNVPTDPPVSLGTALTLPTTPYLLLPDKTFSGFLTDGFSVNWEDNGNSSHTLYTVQASTTSDFLIISTSVLVNAKTCALSNLLTDTTYWVQIQAVGQSELTSHFVTAGSTKTLLYTQSPAVAFQDNTITLETSYGPISIFLPSGSIGSSTKMKLQPKISFAPPVSAVASLKATNIGFEITYFPPTLLFKPVTLTVSYRVSDLPPGTDHSKLILALYDETNEVWVPLPSVSDTAANRVIAQSWHLSIFQIMESNPAAGLAGVKIYPNPYRPSSASDIVHFTNMPPYAKLKIYTFLGELVRDIKADANGMAAWAGENDSGQKAASGVYIALIQTSDKKSGKVFKVVVER